MLDNFFLTLDAVVPLFGLIIIGLIVKKMKLLTDTELVRVNKMVFTIFFFVMMFYNIYTADVGHLFNPALIGFALGMLAAVYIIAFIIVCVIEKNNARRGAMIQGIFRSNFVIMGMPLAANLYGDSNIAVTLMLIAIIVPLYNVLAVFTLELFRGGSCNVGKVLFGMLKNPMIAGAILGAFLLLTGIHLPRAIMRPLAQVAASTTPLALLILGASFKMDSVAGRIKPLLICVTSRLLIVPGVALFFAYQLGFRGIEFVTLLSMFATPSAVAGYAMAQQMNSDAPLAGGCVIFTSALSVFTLFGWLFLYKNLGAF